MPSNQDESEGLEPVLQLQSDGDGPGSGRRTAVGYEFFGENPEIDRTGLKNPPWWFRILYCPFLLERYREQFEGLDTAVALRVLERAGIPPLYRLGLGLRWGFVKSEHPDFNEDVFSILLKPTDKEDLPPNFKVDAARELNAIETRSVYQIWLSSFSSRKHAN